MVKMKEISKSRSKKKKLGQYPTPKHVIQFILSGLNKEPQTILDPNAGNGIFLEECSLKFPSAEIVGVELDEKQTCNNPRIKFFHDDIFNWVKNQIKEKKFQQFSAIVGNPAYVNYQNLNKLTSNSEEEVPEDYKVFLLDSIKEISDFTKESPKLVDVFRLWSKLGDFNAYVLILSWLLTKENGVMAFVMSNHWMERDYGKIIKHFLLSHGSIRAVITHPKGNWFPEAQIPTSIIIYEKGKNNPFQKSAGIPFLVINAPHTDNLEKYIKSISKNIWKWIDIQKKPTTLQSLELSFKKWYLDVNEIKNTTKSKKIPTSLELPSYVNANGWVKINELGWSVHQGLRTGCNEVFYVKKVGKEKYSSTFTINKKKTEKILDIPDSFLIPSIRKFSKNSNLKQNLKNTQFFVLNLSNAIRSTDKSIFDKYSLKWNKFWKSNRNQLIPKNLADFLSFVESMPYESANSKKIVKELSAVKSNIYTPPKNSRKRPNPPKFWYQISFQKRHFGEIITPRVSSGAVPSIWISQKNKLVIDANFLTYVSENPLFEKEKLWVWLNSNTYRIICETNGVKLGGGALKLEASLLSQIPIPKVLENIPIKKFNEIIKTLSESQMDDKSLLETGMKIDSIVFNDEISKSNLRHLKSLIKKRETK